MKYLKYYEANKADFNKIRKSFGLSKDPYDQNVKDTTKTDPRITNLSIRLYKLFSQIGIICEYHPTFRVNKIKQIREGEGHYFTIFIDEVIENSILYFLLNDKEKIKLEKNNNEYDFAINISCDTLSKKVPQIALGDSDEMWIKSINLIKEFFKKYLDSKTNSIINKLITLNMDYNTNSMKSKKPIRIPDEMLTQILEKIVNSSNNQVISNSIKTNNVALYNSLMNLYKKLKKDKDNPLSHADLSKSSDLTEMGFNDDVND
jgi:hypothetical protein